MTDKRKSAEVAELERWFANAAHDDEDWGGELSWLQNKWSRTANELREYKLILREQERQAVIAPTATTEPGRDSLCRADMFLRQTVWCCAMLALGCGVAFIIYKFYL